MAESSRDYVIGAGRGRVRDIPERLRPREEAERVGVEHVADEVLLAILLRGGTRGHSVVEVARSLLRQHETLSALAACSVAELARERGLGRVKAQALKAALELGRRLNDEGLPPRFKIRGPADVARVLGAACQGLETERFWVLHLDTRNCLKGSALNVTRGILDASLVHPREVFREAIRSGVAAMILAHNHPSGDPSPSPDDTKMTRQLVAAGQVVDIKVLDHVILGRSEGSGKRAFFSMREDGALAF